jgi:hypothetical protein
LRPASERSSIRDVQLNPRDGGQLDDEVTSEVTARKAIGPRRSPIAVIGAGVKAPGGSTIDELWDTLCAARSTAEVYVDERLPRDARLLVSACELSIEPVPVGGRAPAVRSGISSPLARHKTPWFRAAPGCRQKSGARWCAAWDWALPPFRKSSTRVSSNTV